jgi:hypothetical protein
MAIRYILWPFGTFFPVLVYCTEENLAALQETRKKYSTPVEEYFFTRAKKVKSETENKVSARFRAANQGCQMVYFQTKNPNLGKICSALEWKM